MAVTSGPEIIPPPRGGGAGHDRLRGRAGRPFSDENLDLLSHLLDDFLRIPGTRIRFGLDGILALFPGIGDVLQGLASSIIIVAAWARGVAPVTLLRMVSNVGIEVLVGLVPFLGDMFDIAWRANRRNYALLTGSLEEPERVRRRSWLFFAGLVAVLLLLAVLPLLLFSWLTAHFLHGMLGMDGRWGFGS